MAGGLFSIHTVSCFMSVSRLRRKPDGAIIAASDAAGGEIPHLKLLAWGPEGDYGKADILGVDRPIELFHRFENPCTDLAVILNTSAACPDDLPAALPAGSMNENP